MSEPVTVFTAAFASPLGPLALVASPEGLCAVGFDCDWARVVVELERRFGAVVLEPTEDPAGAVSALRRYFDGDVRAIEAIPVDTGGTPFQQQVWHTLRRIPAGQTWSYADMAAAIGRPLRDPGGGCSEWREPGGSGAALSPCHRQQRQPHGLRRGPAPEGLAPPPRGCAPLTESRARGE
jgi:methylated-DNA-[protein]-cysteine S-methyltransferase